jgi:hypothetical protein
MRRFCDLGSAVTGDAAGDICDAHGEAHTRHLRQVQVFDQLVDIAGKRIVVMAFASWSEGSSPLRS